MPNFLIPSSKKLGTDQLNSHSEILCNGQEFIAHQVRAKYSMLDVHVMLLTVILATFALCRSLPV